jgi:hypothetical protein
MCKSLESSNQPSHVMLNHVPLSGKALAMNIIRRLGRFKLTKSVKLKGIHGCGVVAIHLYDFNGDTIWVYLEISCIL